VKHALDPSDPTSEAADRHKEFRNSGAEDSGSFHTLGERRELHRLAALKPRRYWRVQQYLESVVLEEAFCFTSDGFRIRTATVQSFTDASS
jgi:hypothetical protein